LRSDNFFNAERFPNLTFRSTGVQRVDDDNWRVTGDLTIRGVTREVVLDTEFEGRIKDPMGKERIGFTAETKINRHDYGLNYNPLLEAGGVMVGDKVTITLHIEAIEE
jgi:polyisoprenoid-binding protein YceI